MTCLLDIPSEHSFRDVVVCADDVRPHERGRDYRHDGDSDDPETGKRFIQSQRRIGMNDVHNVGMSVMDRPHVVEVHALK
jgi:hypothetical protein